MRNPHVLRQFCFILAAMLFARSELLAQGELPSQFFDSDGVRIRFVDTGGSGEPVLLIHGFAADLELNWFASGLAPRLQERGYRVIAYDTRGHGRSDKPYDSSAYGPVEASDAVRLLDYLGVDRAHVIGYSRGGRVAHHLLAEHSDRVRTLILGAFAVSPDGAEDVIAPSPQMIDALAEGDPAPLVRRLEPDASSARVAAVSEFLAQRNDLRALSAVLRSDATFPSLDLTENTIPILVVVGSEDPFSRAAERMRRVARNVEVVELPDATHTQTGDRPEFLTAILGFLAQYSH